MMGDMIKAVLHKSKDGQRGYVYILVLVFLVIGALMIPPLLNFMGTGIWSNPIFEQETEEVYACDAGVDDAIWQIKYENIYTMFPTYDEYDYANVWSYTLGENVNGESVSVDIQNRWIPKDITPPTSSEARDYIEGTDEVGCRIKVNGSATAYSEYRIRIDIIPEEPWVLNVESIGVWLPSGFSYVIGSSNLEYLGYSVDVDSYAGGEAVIWDLGNTNFYDLPPLGSQLTAIVEFEYTSETERDLVTVSWIETVNTGPAGVQIPISWDDDTKVFGITSSSTGGTTVESNVYLSARYSSLLDNAITSPGSTDTQPDTTVNGIIKCPSDGFDPPANGDWEWQDYDMEWPDTEQWRQFFWDDVNVPPPPAPDPGSVVYIEDYDENNPLGPWYRSGDLDIRNNDSNTENALLGGTIYVTGDLDFEQPGTPKGYTLDLDWQTIFVEGEVYFSPDNINITGSGCIIAIGDINFQPNVMSNPGDFIFVCSLEGTVNFNPNGDYYGSVAGQEVVGMQPGSNITWVAPPGGLNLPGMGGSGTGGFGSKITKYTWKIE